MVPRKGFSTFTRVICSDFSPDSYWYVLSSIVCGMTPTHFKRSPVVSSFPEDFQQINSGNIGLQDGRHYTIKRSSNRTGIICSSFGLITVLLRQKTLSEGSEIFFQLREFLNKLDLNIICEDEESEIPVERPRVSRRLEMPSTPPNKQSTSSLVMTPPNTGELKPKVKDFPSLNLKEISEKNDLVLQMKQRGSRVIKDVHDVCERNRESLAVVLSNAFGDPKAKALVNEIVVEVAVKKGVKRTVEELGGDDTMFKYVESLRVPDRKLVLFQAMARVSAKTWQSVINITGLGRTGVRS